MNRINFIKKTALMTSAGLLTPSAITFGNSSKIIGSNEKIKFGAKVLCGFNSFQAFSTNVSDTPLKNAEKNAPFLVKIVVDTSDNFAI